MLSTEAGRLKSMFEMQESLNVYANGAGYKETKICAKTGKHIDYRRCAWMETAKFVDSFDWEHWKHGKNDIENAKTKLVDIWHFLMSAELMENGEADDDMLERTAGIVRAGRVGVSSDEYVISAAEMLVRDLLNLEVHIFPRNGRGEIVMSFFELCGLVGLSFEELYQRYIIKNTLNKFRQDNGYADGTYIKLWHDGKEDNVFAVMLADAIKAELNKDSLYNAMKYFYNSIVKPHNGSFGGSLEEWSNMIKEKIALSLKG